MRPVNIEGPDIDALDEKNTRRLLCFKMVEMSGLRIVGK